MPERSRPGSGRFPRNHPLRQLAAQVAGQSGQLNGLERLDLLGLRALGPPPGGVLNPLVVLKAAVTVSLDSGMVNEDVAGASCTVKNLRCGEETP